MTGSRQKQGWNTMKEKHIKKSGRALMVQIKEFIIASNNRVGERASGPVSYCTPTNAI